jgi:hypothetical protein
MVLICSLISIVVVVGHLISTFRSKTYWPFDYYPMYSLPLEKVLYPVVNGNKLTLMTLIDRTDKTNPKDLFRDYGIFPPMFHPFDKLDVSYILVGASPLAQLQKNGLRQRMDESTRGFQQNEKEADPKKLKEALNSLARLARQNNYPVKRLQVVQLEWNDFRDFKSSYLKPDKITVLEEVTLGPLY